MLHVFTHNFDAFLVYILRSERNGPNYEHF